jgi:tRNA (guanine-N7-)-methyltransferase
MSLRSKNPIRKFLFKHILKKPIQSVQLRGRLSDKDQAFLDQKKGREYLTAAQLGRKVSKAKNQVFLEIGFGNGSHIVSLAQRHPDALIIGSEMYMAGVVNTLRLSEKAGVTNLVVTSEDARHTLKKIQKNALQKIYILFPDPWPKARHNKRRLLKGPFFKTLLEKISTGGEIVVATDWAEYADEIQVEFARIVLHKIADMSDVGEEESTPILQSTFALRAEKEGRSVYLKKLIR